MSPNIFIATNIWPDVSRNGERDIEKYEKNQEAAKGMGNAISITIP